MLAGALDDIHEYYSQSDVQDEARDLINEVSPSNNDARQNCAICL